MLAVWMTSKIVLSAPERAARFLGGNDMPPLQCVSGFDDIPNAAAEWASVGWKVAGLRHDRKGGLNRYGDNVAALNPQDARNLFLRNPDALIGVRLPPEYVLLDLDPTPDVTLADILTSLAPYDVAGAPRVVTPKGLHLWIRVPEGFQAKSFNFKTAQATQIRTGRKPWFPVQNIDVKASGALATIPPTLRNGHIYRWEGFREYPPMASFQLLKALTPPSEPSTADMKCISRPFPGGAVHPYAQAAFEGEIAALAQQSKGGRQEALNNAAFKLGQWIGGGHLPEHDAVRALEVAAKANGHWKSRGALAVRSTIRRGLAAGAKRPRNIPDARN